MCGIAGIICKNGDVRTKLLAVEEIVKVLRHRGPDGEGRYIDEHAILIHRRLIVIDPNERSSQPMFSDDGRFAIIFNGEIYNFKQLRKILEESGFVFKTSSDTEVLLKYYLYKGETGLQDLVGIFSFAIWDIEKKLLFAARDQVGVKPFYYASDDGHFYFASEIKGILAAGWIPELDETKVYESLQFGAIAGEGSLFKGIRRLLPGHFLRLSNSKPFILNRYFEPVPPPNTSINSDEAVGKAYELIEEAVNKQMVSDVPVGTMCSGGLDSSAVTAISSKIVDQIDSYCIRVPYQGYDESHFAKEVSDFTHTTHHQLNFDLDEAGSLLNSLIWLHDEPLRHPNSIPIYQISKLARERVTVLLSGEGADELFGGYGVYFNVKTAMNLNKLPTIFLKLLLGYAHQKNRPGQPILGGLQKDAGNILIHLRSAANPILMKNLMRLPDIRLSDRKNIVTECIERAEGDLINAMLFYDQRTHLCTLLDRQDKMCMGASIESRVPLLDVKLFNFINSLPSNIKTERGNKKRLFRNAMKGKLPDNILYRPKYPFGVPLERYFIDSKQNHHIINKIFNESVLVKKNIVDPKILGSLIRKFLNGNNIHADLIWNFVNLELWYRIFISKEIIQSEFIL